jgi:DNA topoisomerase-1
VKRLEEDGIGRPSTYASIIRTIMDRKYVWRQGKAFVPSFTAFVLIAFLKQNFEELIELDFTGRIEEDLDLISNGERERLAFLKSFYYGDEKGWFGLKNMVDKLRDRKGDYPAYTIGEDPETRELVVVKVGRFGPYVQRGEGADGNRASIPLGITPADFGVREATELLAAKPRIIGIDPKTGLNVYAMSGRFGPYVQLGETPESAPKREKGTKAPKVPKPVKPRRMSLPKGESIENVTLETAMRLLSLPREIGIHPDDGTPIESNFGRFGPYVKHAGEFRSLESEERVFTITFDEAVELLRQPKRGRRGAFGAGKKEPLKELGKNSDGADVRLFDGRYGPYVTDGKINATVPKGIPLESVALVSALDWLADKAAKGPIRRPRATKKKTKS